jgi:ferric iron reductase protein FhuF
MVRLCEVEGFIPRYHEEESPDIVDITIKDISQYVEHLVKSELNLGTLIESALKQMQHEQDKAESEGDEDIWETEVELSDNNYNEFSQMLQEDYEADYKGEE